MVRSAISEVQRAHSDDHLKRAGYNVASIVTKNTEPGERFENVPRVIIVYISERDFLGYGRTIYHIDKVIRENGEPIDDGLQEVHDPRFTKLSSRVYYLKEQERGVAVMCEIMEKYMEEAKAAGIKEGEAAGMRQAICRMIKNGFDRQTILELGYTELEYEEARESLPASV